MPEPKFTPGPWDFDRSIWWENTPGEQEKHGSLVVYPSNNPNGDDLTIAEVNDFFDKEIGKANAHLIAAAPDLYAALEHAASALELGHPLLADRRLWPDACLTPSIQTCNCALATEYKLVLAALRKARGAS